MKKAATKTKFSTLFLGIFFSTLAIANEGEAPQPRLSPPTTTSGTVGTAIITINYGSPSVRSRKIWNELVPYNEVWRAGANEATTFETDKDIKVEGKLLRAGKYGFFTIPTGKKWTIIFNKVWDQWGAFKYEEKEDALRVKVKPVKSDAMKERLVYTLTEKGFNLSWENLDVPVSIKPEK